MNFAFHNNNTHALFRAVRFHGNRRVTILLKAVYNQKYHDK